MKQHQYEEQIAILQNKLKNTQIVAFALGSFLAVLLVIVSVFIRSGWASAEGQQLAGARGSEAKKQPTWPTGSQSGKQSSQNQDDRPTNIEQSNTGHLESIKKQSQKQSPVKLRAKPTYT